MFVQWQLERSGFDITTRELPRDALLLPKLFDRSMLAQADRVEVDAENFPAGVGKLHRLPYLNSLVVSNATAAVRFDTEEPLAALELIELFSGWFHPEQVSKLAVQTPELKGFSCLFERDSAKGFSDLPPDWLKQIQLLWLASPEGEVDPDDLKNFLELFPEITKLRLHGFQLGDSDVTWMAELGVRELDLFETQLNLSSLSGKPIPFLRIDSEYTDIQDVARLQVKTLVVDKFNASSFPDVGAVGGLENIYLNFENPVSAEIVVNFLTTHPTIRYLSVSPPVSELDSQAEAFKSSGYKILERNEATAFRSMSK